MDAYTATFIMALLSLGMAVPEYKEVLDKEMRQEDHDWGPPIEGFRLSLRSAKIKYTIGEKMEVKIVFQNVDTKNRVVGRLDPPPVFFEFQVTDSAGKSVPMSESGQELKLNVRRAFRVTLKPKQEMFFDQDISELFDLQKPGDYRVIVKMDVKQQKNPDKWSTLTSNPLTITMIEAAAMKAQVKRWIADLESDSFAAREKAEKELANVVEFAEADLKKALLDKDLSLEQRRRIERLLQKLKQNNEK